MTREWTTQITNAGHLPGQMHRAFDDLIRSLAGKLITIRVSSAETSSASQRKYYFGVIVKAYVAHFAAKGKYYDKDDMHDMMMRAVGGFSNHYVNPFTGEPDCGRMSYNKLTKAQAEGYHTLCRQWAAEAKPSFDIPEPNEIPISAYEDNH